MNNKLFKTVESRLYNYKRIDIEISNIKLEIKELQTEYLGIKNKLIDARTKTNEITSTVENEIIAKEKEINKKEESILYKEIEKLKIENALKILSDDELKLIDLFYSTSQQKKVYIAKNLNIDIRTMYRYRKNIIEKLIEILYN